MTHVTQWQRRTVACMVPSSRKLPARPNPLHLFGCEVFRGAAHPGCAAAAGELSHFEELAAAKKGRRRYGQRDAAMILVAFRRGLRVSELCALTWDQIDFAHGLIHVRRMKNGIP